MNKTILSIIFTLSSFLHAQTIHFVPADFNSIQEAIDAAEDFDQIIVSPGTYFENINFNGKSLEISSNYIFDNDPNTISSTIINGGSNGRVVQINNSFFAGLNGFTITNGSHPGGAGVYSTLSTIELSNLIITENTASDDGGGIHCHDCYMLLDNTTISLNSASVFGGGVFIENDSQVAIVDCDINNNTSNSSGGGVYVTATNNYNKDVHITCSEISNNTGTGISTSNSMLVLADVVITENTQIGLAMGDATNIQANNTYIVNNNEELINGQAFDLYSYGSTGLGFSNSVVGLITNSGAVPGEGNSSNCFGCTETSENAATQALISCIVTGCTNTSACNYNASATEDDGSCILPVGCDTCSGETDGTGVVVDNDTDGDGVCNDDEIAGCQDATACNYNVSATDDDGSCEYIEQVTISGETETCEENILLEASGPYDVYQWYLDGDIISSETQPTITANTTGNYKVEVQNGVNYSLQLDGENDYIDLGVGPFLGEFSKLTIMTWIKPAVVSGVVENGNIFSIGNETHWLKIKDQKANFGISGAGNEVSSVTTIQPNEWVHVTGVYTGSEVQIYINGNLESTGVLNGSYNDTGFPILIGYEPGSNEYYEGLIDELSIWGEALTGEQIQNYIDCPPTGSETGIINCWKLEEEGQALIFDSTNNTFNGQFVNIITNNAWPIETPEISCQQTCLSSEEVFVSINNCGCTDPNSCNYNINANVDNGSCNYLDDCGNCGDPLLGPTDLTYGGYFEGSHYYTSNTTTNWVEANNICNSFGGHLVTIETQEEQDYIYSLISNPGSEFYIGLFQNTESPGFIEPNGGWEWVTGCPLDYSNWNIGQPNNNGLENYAQITTTTETFPPSTTGLWNDVFGTEDMFYIMELSCPQTGCIDANACNYNCLATENDGSCEYPNECGSCVGEDDCLGCTDSGACNYNSEATVDDGSCEPCSSREFNDGAYLDVDSEITNAQGITISFWVNDNDFCANPEDFATYIDFGSQDTYRYVVRNRSCKIEAFFEGEMLPTEFDWGTMDWGYPKASAAGGIGPQSGWRQITTVFCPTTIRVYVDGNIVASNGTGVYFQEGFNLFADDIKRIGSNQVDYEPANAMIDEVRIWNRALSGEEVLARAGGATTLNMDEEINLNGYWQMDCANPFLNQVTGQLGSDNLSVVNENFNGNSCETSSEYNNECSLDFEGNPDCNSCDPPEGCTDEEACNYDYLAVISIPSACFYIADYCPDLEYPEYYDCDCKCINDSDSDDVCDELELDGCSEDENACNYNPDGTEPCEYPIDIYDVDYVDCDGNCLNDIDGDSVCDEDDNCVDVYNPNQEDLNNDGIGDDCDGVGLEELGDTKKIIKVTDVLGREIQKETKGSTLMYWYNTGEVDIKYIF